MLMNAHFLIVRVLLKMVDQSMQPLSHLYLLEIPSLCGIKIQSKHNTEEPSI